MGALGEETETTECLLAQISSGDTGAFERLFAQHRDQLRKAVDLRLDPRLRARFDASDVVQDAQVEAFRRLPDFLARRPMPFGLWLLKTAHQRLVHLRRHHLDAQRRTVSREVRFSEESSLAIAKVVIANQTSLCTRISQRERAEAVASAIEQLDDDSREVLLMRHVEGLNHQQVADILELTSDTVRKRYARALIKLQRELARGGLNQLD